MKKLGNWISQKSSGSTSGDSSHNNGSIVTVKLLSSEQAPDAK